jgi:hypothetical protein
MLQTKSAVRSTQALSAMVVVSDGGGDAVAYGAADGVDGVTGRRGNRQTGLITTRPINPAVDFIGRSAPLLSNRMWPHGLCQYALSASGSISAVRLKSRRRGYKLLGGAATHGALPALRREQQSGQRASLHCISSLCASFPSMLSSIAFCRFWGVGSLFSSCLSLLLRVIPYHILPAVFLFLCL